MLILLTALLFKMSAPGNRAEKAASPEVLLRRLPSWSPSKRGTTRRAGSDINVQTLANNWNQCFDSWTMCLVQLYVIANVESGVVLKCWMHTSLQCTSACVFICI